jgi:hypothetical protein
VSVLSCPGGVYPHTFWCRPACLCLRCDDTFGGDYVGGVAGYTLLAEKKRRKFGEKGGEMRIIFSLFIFFLLITTAFAKGFDDYQVGDIYRTKDGKTYRIIWISENKTSMRAIEDKPEYQELINYLKNANNKDLPTLR